MKQEVTSLPPLGIAGKLHRPQSQIGVSLHADRTSEKARQRIPLFQHDEGVRACNGRQIGGKDYRKDQRVIQATGSLKNGSATGASSEHRDSLKPACLQIDLGRISIGIPDHDKISL